MGSLEQQDVNFVVTGATGWLGRASLDLLESRLGTEFEQRVFAFSSKPGTTKLLSSRSVPYSGLDSITTLPPGRYVFLHCAFLGKERVAELPLSDFISINDAISEKVCAAARRVEVAGLFVPSSGAVYGKDGVLETNAQRNPYGFTKHKDERRFSALAEEIDTPLIIARVFNIAGPYINKLSSYALGSIISDILARQSIRLRADHPVIRSYVHVYDLLALTLACLDKGANQLFDTQGEIEIEVGDLTRVALDVLGWPEGPIERPTLHGETNRYVGDGTAMRALTAHHDIAFRPLPQQVRETAAFLARPL